VSERIHSELTQTRARSQDLFCETVIWQEW